MLLPFIKRSAEMTSTPPPICVSHGVSLCLSRYDYIYDIIDIISRVTRHLPQYILFDFCDILFGLKYVCRRLHSTSVTLTRWGDTGGAVK